MPELAPANTTTEPAATGRYFVRFTRQQRYMHAVLFTTFLGLAATGLPMRFSESFWARKFAAGVGGFGAILFFHKLCALVLTVAFLIHVKEVFQRGIFRHEKGIFWGPTSMVRQLERRERTIRPHALVPWPRAQSRNSSATPTGKSSITGRCSGA